jgi:hypothetical protein
MMMWTLLHSKPPRLDAGHAFPNSSTTTHPGGTFTTCCFTATLPLDKSSSAAMQGRRERILVLANGVIDVSEIVFQNVDELVNAVQFFNHRGFALWLLCVWR